MRSAIVENTHEAIISQADFDIVQAMHAEKNAQYHANLGKYDHLGKSGDAFSLLSSAARAATWPVVPADSRFANALASTASFTSMVINWLRLSRRTSSGRYL
mgnify:CR=1 FL=1